MIPRCTLSTLFTGTLLLLSVCGSALAQALDSTGPGTAANLLTPHPVVFAGHEPFLQARALTDESVSAAEHPAVLSADPAYAGPVARENSIPAWLERNGIQPHFSIKTEGSFVGGDAVGSQRADGRNLIETALEIDLGKKLGWSGALFHTSMHSFAGGDGSALLAGDAQGFSNISSTPDTLLFEIWLQQSAMQDKLTVKAGKIEANTDFDYVENAGYFLQSAMGHSPTLFDMPTYPHPRPGVEVSIAPKKHLYFRSGVFQNVDKGVMVLSEAGTRWQLPGVRLPGRFAYGYWTRTPMEPGLSDEMVSGSAGHYLVAEQAIWKPETGNEGRGLAAFFQFGNASPEVSPFRQHFGGGVQWTGLLASRPADVIGLGTSVVRVSPAMMVDANHGHECSFETFYQVGVNRWATLTPDVQYIDHPSADPLRPRVAVMSVRLSIAR